MVKKSFCFCARRCFYAAALGANRKMPQSQGKIRHPATIIQATITHNAYIAQRARYGSFNGEQITRS